MHLGNSERRRWLRNAMAVAGGVALPRLQAAAQQGSQALHESIAVAAKELAAGSTVPLRLLLPQGSGANMAPVITAFEQMSGVRVTPVEIALDQINTQLALDALSGDGSYDLALPASFGVPDLVAAGALLPLDDLAARYEPAGFRDGILYQAGDRFDGRTYGFQCDGDAYLMFYNADLVDDPAERERYADAHGKALEVPQTWDELDRQMAFFNRPDDGIVGGLLYRTQGFLAWEWWLRFHAKGYWPLSPTLRPQFDTDAGVEALEQMIAASASLAPGSDSMSLFDSWERYSHGDVYCTIGWGGSQKYFNRDASAVKGRLHFGPTPGGMVNNELVPAPFFNWGWDHVVTSSSTRPELAYLFALFAASPVQSTASVRPVDGYFDPFRAEHYEDDAVRTAYSDEFLAVHKASLVNAIPDLYIAERGEYFRALNEWLFRAMQGRTPPREALSNVARRWELISERAGRSAQQKRWMALRARYPHATARHLRDLKD